jgi:hypothetical protein
MGSMSLAGRTLRAWASPTIFNKPTLPFAALHATDVVAVEAGQLGQALLREETRFC